MVIHRAATLALACLSLTACTDPVAPIDDNGGDDGDTGTGTEGEGEGPPLGEGEGENPPAGEGEGETPPVPTTPTVTRFVAVGDSGKGNDGQFAVADAMEAVCNARGGCAFAVMLGDNIYDSGVDGNEDSQWMDKFELPYANLDFPFYSTLGNHDYGAPDVMQSFAGGIGIDPRRGAAQVEYTATGGKFFMPDTHYRLQHGPIELVSLNTASLFWTDLSFIERVTGYREENDRQRANLRTWAADPLATWRIAFGHHPYLSNGPHGNAGRYDNVVVDGLVGSGTGLKEFFEEHVLGQFDVYLCGHDHSVQDLGTVQGTELLVSGGGSSHTDFSGDNETFFQADRMGFLLVEATETELKFQFVVIPDDGDGATAPFTLGPVRTVTR